MQCQEVRFLLYRLVDGRLLDRDADAVREHFKSCRACRKRYRQIVRLDEYMMSAEAEQLPARLRERLLTTYRRRIANKMEPKHRGWMRLVSLRRAAAIALVAVLSGGTTWTVVRHGGGVPGTPLTETQARMDLDHVFPLVLSDSFTMVHPDGRRESGTRIRIVE